MKYELTFYCGKKELFETGTNRKIKQNFSYTCITVFEFWFQIPSKTCISFFVHGSHCLRLPCVYCAAAGTIFGTTDVYELGIFIFLLASLLIVCGPLWGLSVSSKRHQVLKYILNFILCQKSYFCQCSLHVLWKRCSFPFAKLHFLKTRQNASNKRHKTIKLRCTFVDAMQSKFFTKFT